jgi:hypothetical protein
MFFCSLELLLCLFLLLLVVSYSGPPPPPPRCSYITPYIGIFCSPYQTFRNGLEHYKLLEGIFYMKRELVTLGALTECVLLNFLYVSVFFCFVCLRCVWMPFTCRRSYKQLHTSGSVHIWWCYIQEWFLYVDAVTNNSTLVGLYTFGSVIYKYVIYLSTWLPATPHWQVCTHLVVLYTSMLFTCRRGYQQLHTGRSVHIW